MVIFHGYVSHNQMVYWILRDNVQETPINILGVFPSTNPVKDYPRLNVCIDVETRGRNPRDMIYEHILSLESRR